MTTAIHKKRTGRRRRKSLILSPFSNKTRTLHGIANTDWNLIASRTEKIMSKLNTSGTSNADVGPVDTGNLKIERPKSGGIRVKAAHDSAPNNDSHTEKVKKNQRTKSGCIKSASHDSTHAAFPNKNSQTTLKPNVRRGRRTSLTGGTPRKKQVDRILSTSGTSKADVGPVDTGNLKVKRPKSSGIRVKATGKTLRKKKKKAQFPVLGHKTIKKGVSKASAANAEKSDCETSKSRTSRV